MPKRTQPRWRSLPSLFVISCVFAWAHGGTSLARASEYGDFQREIEHDRAFQREMDDQRDRTNAINQPSTYKPPQTPVVTVQAWMAAKAEASQREAAAREARNRDFDLRHLREENRRKEQEAAAREYKSHWVDRLTAPERNRLITAVNLSSRGLAPHDSDVLSYFVTPNERGEYASFSTAQLRAGIDLAGSAKEEFNRTSGTASREKLIGVVRQIEVGGEGRPVPPFSTAFTTLLAYQTLWKRFHDPEDARATLRIFQAWTDWVPARKMDETWQKRLISQWGQTVVEIGEGETEFLDFCTYFQSQPYQRVKTDDDVAAVVESWYKRERAKGDDQPSRESGSLKAALADQGRRQVTAGKFAAAIESYLRSYEVAGSEIQPQDQTSLAALLDAHPERVAAISPDQWRRFSSVPGLALPVLLREMPNHIDPVRFPEAARRMRINLAGQKGDVLAALAIAYECFDAQGQPADPTSLSQALRVAAAMIPGATSEQNVATHRARALSILLYSPRGKPELSVVQDGVDAQVPESRYVACVIAAQVASSPAEIETAQDMRDALGDPTLWDGRVKVTPPEYYLARAWYVSNERNSMQKAISQFRKGAEHGDMVCATELGVLLTSGNSNREQWVEGRHWLERASVSEPAAAARLGVLKFLGRAGFSADPASALALLRQGLKGHLRFEAMYCMGVAYADGIGVKKDTEEALKWLKATKGMYAAAAAVRSATIYFTGDGVPQDLPKAKKLVLRFADRGDRKAMALMGVLVLKGADPRQTVDDAIDWWRKAADAGDFLSARNIYATRMRQAASGETKLAALAELESFLERQTPDFQFQGGRLLLNQGPAAFPENTIQLAHARFWMERAAKNGSNEARAWLDANSSPGTDVASEPKDGGAI